MKTLLNINKNTGRSFYFCVDKHEDKHDKSFTVYFGCLETINILICFMKYIVTSIDVWCGECSSVVLVLSYSLQVGGGGTRGLGPHSRVKLSEDYMYIKQDNEIYSTISEILWSNA